ncbi:hypothetical protein B0H16DRAFT_1484900 [Mycena metata]|uniref:Uncharacterized protein n=1 Tax=Mycena metata TaxID=1033252 RepID=A0AAD7GN57_9AGAR|nr:hypothetical protein B0H16DRAFT_1484900 [Mycena metata]
MRDTGECGQWEVAGTESACEKEGENWVVGSCSAGGQGGAVYGGMRKVPKKRSLDRSAEDNELHAVDDEGAVDERRFGVNKVTRSGYLTTLLGSGIATVSQEVSSSRNSTVVAVVLRILHCTGVLVTGSSIPKAAIELPDWVEGRPWPARRGNENGNTSGGVRGHQTSRCHTSANRKVTSDPITLGTSAICVSPPSRRLPSSTAAGNCIELKYLSKFQPLY